MNRKNLLVLALNLWAVLTTASVFANPDTVPIDPLVRPKTAGGNYEVSVGLAYVPYGRESLVIHDMGVSTQVELRQQLFIPIQLRYHLTETLTLSTLIEPKTQRIQTKSQSHGGSKTTSTTAVMNERIEFRFQNRFFRHDGWEPAVDMSIDLPTQTLGSSISGSFIADPVVLSAALNHTADLTTGRQRLMLSLGTGFYVNERISFHATTHHSVPVGHVALPSWTGSLSIVYALDLEGTKQVSVGVVTTKQATDGNVGLTFEWRTR